MALAGLAALPVLLGRPAADREPPPAPPPARPGATPTPAATPAALEATLAVRHYRRGVRPGLVLSLGEFGERTASARPGDVARVEARFSAPVYAYLVALNPDGSVQPCEPADAHVAPPSSALVSFPPGEGDYFGFTDGKGLQAFVVVASRHPLPPFADWAAGRALSWSSLPAAGVWSFDGRRWEPHSGPDAESRGRIIHLEGVPTPLAEACRRLAERPAWRPCGRWPCRWNDAPDHIDAPMPI